MWGSSKFVRTLRGRSNAHHILIEWSEKVRDQNRPLVWLHAASVGEALQAMVVLEALRERVSGLQVVFTFFSPFFALFTSFCPILTFFFFDQ